MRTVTYLYIIGCLAGIAIHSPLVAGETDAIQPAGGPATAITEPEIKQARADLDKVWHTLEAINTADVSISATFVRNDDKPERTEEWRWLFDRERPLVRFDRSGDGRLTQFVRTPDYYFIHAGNGGGRVEHINVFDPEQKHGMAQVEPIDVLSIGVVNADELQSRYGLKDVRTSLDTAPIIEWKKEEDGVARITWLVGSEKSPVRRTLWIDANRGFTPVKLRQEQRQTDADEWKQVTHSVVVWEKHDDIWVPKSAEMSVAIGKRKVVARLSLDWRVVNDKLPGNCFDPAGLGVKDGTLIIDHRQGPPVANAVIRMGQVVPR